jgi:hypothetical protein
MALASILFIDTFERDLNVISASRPTWLAAFATGSSTAHISSFSFVVSCLLILFELQEIYSKFGNHHPNSKREIRARLKARLQYDHADQPGN